MPIPLILVADDNPVSLHFFVEALGTWGIDVVPAGDGAAAVERACASPFDLLLLDACMPKLDGAQALARIRAQEGPSRQAIALATTADARAAMRTLLLGAGFAEILVKPIGMHALRSALARHLPIPPAAPRIDVGQDGLDDTCALRAAGGDSAIVSALRGLLLRELDTLPTEVGAMVGAGDADALRERLHRLDASAGFCGAPSLTRACANMRAVLDTPVWAQHALSTFLAACGDCALKLGAD